MPKSKRTPGEKKLPGGATLFSNNVKIWGSEDPKTYMLKTAYECQKCGAKNELVEELPNLQKRAEFRLEAKTHSCGDTLKSRQFTQMAVEEEKKRRDIHG